MQWPEAGGWTLGVICIVLVAIDWSFSSVLVQAIFEAENFSKPIFLTWVGNSLFALLLPTKVLVDAARRTAQRLELRCFGVACFGAGNSTAGHGPDSPATPAEESDAEPSCEAAPDGSHDRSTVRYAAWSGGVIAPVWFAANCSYNISMSLTSITSSTVISASSAAFTLLLSVQWLGERATPLKLLGVGLCWLGNALTVFSDDSAAAANATADGGGGPSHSFLGDLVCLVGALLYAAYTVAIRKLAPPDISLFFGFLGLTTFVLFAPLVLLLHATAYEDVSALSAVVFGLIVLKGLVDNVLSEYLWVRSPMTSRDLPLPLVTSFDLTWPPMISRGMHRSPVTCCRCSR